MTWIEYEPESLVDDPGFLRLRGDAALLYVLLVHRSMRHGHLQPDESFYRMLWGARIRRFSDAWSAVLGVCSVDEVGLLCWDWVDEARSQSTERLKSDRARKRNARMEAREAAMSAGHPKDVPRTSAVPTDRPTDRPTNIVAGKPRRAAVSVSTPGYHEAIAVWCECFQKVTGQHYGFDGGKDGKHIKAILGFAKGDLDMVRSRALILLNAAPGWIDEGGKDLGTLRSQWNKLVSQQTGQATGSKLLAVQEANGRAQSASVKLEPLPTTKRMY